MSEYTITTTWGGYLAHHVPKRGLNPLVDAIHRVVGEGAGARTSFAALFDLDELPTRDAKADRARRYRAWLLVTILELDPAAFGLDDDDATLQRWDPETLRELLKAESRCIALHELAELVGAA